VFVGLPSQNIGGFKTILQLFVIQEGLKIGVRNLDNEIFWLKLEGGVDFSAKRYPKPQLPPLPMLVCGLPSHTFYFWLLALYMMYMYLTVA
jgi:hypothetical protein